MGYLRLILALCVVIAHSNSFLGISPLSGSIAVESFFIISGFYMSLILNEKYLGPNSYKLFISNRFLRLFPLYWIVLLLTILITGFTNLFYLDEGVLSMYEQYKISNSSLLFLIFTNIFVFGQDIVMFLKLTPLGDLSFTTNFRNSDPELWTFLAVPQAWSLSLELMFYIIAPFLVRLSTKKLLIIISFTVALRCYFYLYLGLYRDPWNYRFFPLEISFFLLGSLGYKIYNKLKYVNQVNLNKVQKIIFCLVILFTLSYQFIHLDNFIKQFLYYLLITVSLPFLFNMSKHNKIESKIGELSYPVYIVHWLVIYIISLFGIDKGTTYFGEFVVFVTIFFSIILTTYITEPIEKIRQKRIKTKQNNSLKLASKKEKTS